MMRICIIAQEEPVYFGPFLRDIIKARSKEIVCLILVGERGAGNHPKNFRQKFRDNYILWLIFEPAGYIKMFLINFWFKFLKTFGLLGSTLDHRSISGIAKEYGIPIFYTHDINSPEVISQMCSLAPDVIINQGEMLIKDALLEIPKLGIINRHASLLPHFPGRLASFWGHAQEPPEYGVTIHFLSRAIDQGPIIVQERYNLDPRWSYGRILENLFKESSGLMLRALEVVGSSSDVAQSNQGQRCPLKRFPTLDEAKCYRQILKKRRLRLGESCGLTN